MSDKKKSYLEVAMEVVRELVKVSLEDGEEKADPARDIRNLMLVQSLALISIAQSLEKIELAIYRTNQ